MKTLKLLIVNAIERRNSHHHIMATTKLKITSIMFHSVEKILQHAKEFLLWSQREITENTMEQVGYTLTCLIQTMHILQFQKYNPTTVVTHVYDLNKILAPIKYKTIYLFLTSGGNSQWTVRHEITRPCSNHDKLDQVSILMIKSLLSLIQKT